MEPISPGRGELLTVDLLALETGNSDAGLGVIFLSFKFNVMIDADCPQGVF